MATAYRYGHLDDENYITSVQRIAELARAATQLGGLGLPPIDFYAEEKLQQIISSATNALERLYDATTLPPPDADWLAAHIFMPYGRIQQYLAEQRVS